MEQTHNAADPLALRDARSRFSRVGLACFAYIVTATVLQLLMSFLSVRFAPELLSADFYNAILVALPQYVVALPVCYLIMRGVQTGSVGAEKMGVGRFLKIVLIALGIMYVGNLIGSGLMGLVGSLRGREVANAVELIVNETNPYLSAIMLVILAPIVEELIFRKFLIDRLARYGEAAAVLASAVLFALMHGNFYQFFYAFGLGGLFAYVYVKTGKIGYPVALHAIINAIGGVISPALYNAVDFDLISGMASIADMSELSEESMAALNSAMVYSVYSYALLAAGFAGIILLIVSRKRISFKPGICAIPKGSRFKTMYLNAGMILMFVASAALFVLTQLV